MKYLILLLILITIPANAYSQEPTAIPSLTISVTPSVSPTAKESDKIQELKEKVADKVASLQNDKLGGISGILKSSSEEALILLSDNSEFSVQLDEDGTVYQMDSSLKRKSVQLDSLEKDSYLTVIGTIDREKRTVEASSVIARQPNFIFLGNIASVSTKDGTVTIKSNKQQELVFDIEVTTKSNIYSTQTKKLVKIGMSKMNQNQKIHIVAISGKTENRYEAVRILILP